MKASVIIPCHNEGKRIIPIINEIKKSKLIREIIIVDDGSDLYTKKILDSIRGIRLITHEKNLGKSAAIMSGVFEARSNILLFLDSDITNFKTYHADAMLKEMADNNCDMILGEWERDMFFSKLIGFSTAYTGQRAVYKNKLIRNVEIFDFGDYLLEPAMNKIFLNKSKTGIVILGNVGQVFKIQKSGIIGFLKDVGMWISYVKFLGFREFTRQLSCARKLKYNSQ